MKILDANIFIYAPQPSYTHLRTMLIDPDCVASDITRVEVLGYHRLDQQSKTYYEAVFRRMTCLPVTTDILDQAIDLRQAKKMSLGDSIVAATALLNNLELNTHNINDFSHIKVGTCESCVILTRRITTLKNPKPFPIHSYWRGRCCVCRRTHHLWMR